MLKPWLRAALAGVALVCMTVPALFVKHELDRHEEQWHANVSSRIVKLLNEASKVGQSVDKLKGEPCTIQNMNELARAAAQSPHVRGVWLLEHGVRVCSSQAGARKWNVSLLGSRNISPGTDNILYLTTHDQLTPGLPVLVLLLGEGNSQVAVTVNGLFIQRHLRGSPGESTFRFRVGDAEMDVDGNIRKVDSAPLWPVDNRWPFSLQPDPLRQFSWWRMLFIAWPWLLLSVVVMVSIVLLFQRWMQRCKSPGTRLSGAIQKGEIVPWYQPVVCASTGKLSGCEVLARWFSPDGNAVPADTFIPLAEESGLIIPLTHHLIKKVASDLAPVAGRLPENFHLAINISAGHASEPQFVTDCCQLQEVLSACPVQLVVEITERERFEPSPSMLAMLTSLRAAGIRVALDDFGTGYSGLSCLENLPVDYLKLDRSFTARTGGDEPATARLLMAEMVTEIAERLGLEVVAEGVETEKQRDWMVLHGVRWLQGYWFARPMPAEAFVRLILSGKHQLPDPTVRNDGD